MAANVAVSPHGAGNASAISTPNQPLQNMDLTFVRRENHALEHRKSRLKELPDEVLLQIATQLCGSRALAKFSRVDKRIHAIANEAMAKNLVVREDQFKPAIEWLIKHPGLLHAVNFVEITEPRYIKTSSFSTLSGSNMRATKMKFDPNDREILRDLIVKQPDGTRTWTCIHTDARPTGWFALSSRYYMDLISKLCPNIKSVNTLLYGPRDFDDIDPHRVSQVTTSQLPVVNWDCIPSAPFHDTALEVMQENLESLTISQDPHWAGPAQHELLNADIDVVTSTIGRPPITLRGFKLLRHLDVPMDALGLPFSIVLQQPGEGDNIGRIRIPAQGSQVGANTKELHFPAKIIPLTLKTLHLRSSNGSTFALLGVISLMPVGMSNFKHIDVFFTTSARELIHLCDQAEWPSLDYIKILWRLQNMGIEVSFYSGKNETTVDMCQELEIMDALTPEEVCIAAATSCQFTDFNELAIKRRRVTRLAHLLFMKHALTHFDILNSSTFDANKWRPVALFRGKKYIKRLGKAKLPGELARSQGVHRLPKRRPTGLLDLDKFTFAFCKPMPRRLSPPPTVFRSSQKYPLIWTQPITEKSVQPAGARTLADRLCAAITSMTVITKEAVVEKFTDFKAEATAYFTEKSRSRTSKKILKGAIERKWVRMGCFDPIEFESPDEQIKLPSSGFPYEVWQGVEWKKYLQPRVVR